MNTRTLRFIGVALIVAAVATGAGLQLAGADVFHFHGEGGLLPTHIEFAFHWLALVLLAVAFAGLLCIVIAFRKRPYPNETRND